MKKLTDSEAVVQLLTVIFCALFVISAVSLNLSLDVVQLQELICNNNDFNMSISPPLKFGLVFLLSLVPVLSNQSSLV